MGDDEDTRRKSQRSARRAYAVSVLETRRREISLLLRRHTAPRQAGKRGIGDAFGIVSSQRRLELLSQWHRRDRLQLLREFAHVKP